MTRMVDYTFGLKLSYTEHNTTNAAFGKLPMNLGSLNQTLDFPRFHPLFLDIELKKSLSNEDPRVQLAVWKLAWLKKMQIHGWDSEVFPVPGITIEGHVWKYYLFYKSGSNLVRPTSLSGLPDPLLRQCAYLTDSR